MSTKFVHLHLHTQYSLLDGAVRIHDLFPKIKELGMDTVAITDHGNMFGAINFYTQAKANNVKPIIGCETYISSTSRTNREKRSSNHLVLLAKNQTGYKNLLYLVSEAYLNGFYYDPRIDKEILSQYSQGLIGLSACLGGEIPQAIIAGNKKKAVQLASEYKEIFAKDDFYLELQLTGYKGQEEVNQALMEIAKKLKVPLVATNDVHYLNADDAFAHKVLVCIQTGECIGEEKENRKLDYTDKLYLKSSEEMEQLFSSCPESIENTLKIAQECNLDIELGKVYLPKYEVPNNYTLESYLQFLARDGLEKRLNEAKLAGYEIEHEKYKARLELELEVILKMGYAGYFLIVWDFINASRKNNIPVGPGRGSGAGSLVAYSLRITDLDPIKYGLLFERFLNPERISMPDFDVDFCKDRRDDVIKYVTEKYGKENVGQIATFHQLKSRSVVRDVGRVMGISYAEVDKIAKLIPEPQQGRTFTIDEALKEEPKLKELYENDEKVKQLLDYALKLEGLNRHAGTHAAGVVIGDKPLWEYVPVFKGSNGEIVTQYDKDIIESVGLVKFDFLGLKTLTVLDTAIKLIKQKPGFENFKIESIPLDDLETYKLLQSGNTTGVFQLESTGIKELLRRLKPDRFEDIIAAVALYRPGPLGTGMVEDYIMCKHGQKEIVYPHPLLEKVLNETYGILVYQEQVMQAASLLAGFSLGQADILRRAMGKKKAEVMAKQKDGFVAGAVKNGVDKDKAEEIFDLIAKFAGYGFNKSHSAAYALISYQTAYLKAHFPVEFLATLLTCDKDNTDKIVVFIAEGKRLGIEILPPDINESYFDFTIIYDNNGTGKVRFGLGAVKGVGGAALESILQNRKEGNYNDLFDFCSRVDLHKVNRGVIESLIKSGAFDTTVSNSITRGQILEALDSALEYGKSTQRERSSGQVSLFSLLEVNSENKSGDNILKKAEYPVEPKWTSKQILMAEKESLGIYLQSHPLIRYKEFLDKLQTNSVEDVETLRDGQRVNLCGIVENLKLKKVKDGSSKMGFFNLEDLTGRVEVVVRPKILEQFQTILLLPDPIQIQGVIQRDERGEEERIRVVMMEGILLEDALRKLAKEVHLKVDLGKIQQFDVNKLHNIIEHFTGRYPTFLHFLRENSEAIIKLPDNFRVNLCEDFMSQISSLVEDFDNKIIMEVN